MKELRQKLVFGSYTIKFYDEIDYISDINSYYKVFISGDIDVLTSQIGIELFENERLISSCLIGSGGGGTGITENSFLFSQDELVVCCSNTVFKLTIPNLNLQWKTVADIYTCFGIYNLEKDYIIRGEGEITRLNNNGEIVWQRGGRDIWTTAEGVDDFAIYDNYILATDWDYYRYKFDFDGNLLKEYKVKPNEPL